jgi:hypothetical protein
MLHYADNCCTMLVNAALFDEMSIMNSMSNLFDVEIGNRSRDGCGATLG